MITFFSIISFTKKLIFTLVYFLQLFSSLYTLLRNPGTPKREKFSSTAGIKRYKICKICNVIMNLDKKTYHCPDCEICVIGNLSIINKFIFF